MARIGIMGGTFDPIHNGHLLLGKQAYQEYDLKQIWFMPSGRPPHKLDQAITGSRHRCDMVKLAIRDEPHFVFSDFEINRKGNTYTADTIQALMSLYHDHHFYFIIGADSLFQIESWYQPEIIFKCVPLLVAGREYEQAPRTIAEQIQYLQQKYDGQIQRLHCQEVDISSEHLRRLAADGKPLHPYVPKQVDTYIKNHHLYEE